MSVNKKFGLGRGIDTLLSDDDINIDDIGGDVENFINNTVFKDENTGEINVGDIEPCSFQPRTVFDETALESLSASIKEKGVLQPLLLRRKNGKYEIIAGERRWRAAIMAGLSTVPALVKDLNDEQTLEIALIENLQRENLSPIEEAEGFNRLMSQYSYTQEVLSKIIGKSRSYIANVLRLLNLPPEVQEFIKNGKLSAGHARVLVGNPQATLLAKEIIEKGLSVRQVEQLMTQKAKPSTPKIIKDLDADLQKIISDLERKLDLKVKINAGKNGKGSVTLKYNNPAELSSILDLLEQR
ncbi:MAG: ParB/RepB/Spo0J family partition protein [Alphaproteobacteria bacterium]|nr:ParB/RepB/Spo0J family partition protein [Alphaproteobacteria bacterium]